MRIVIVSHGFPPLAQGGAEIYAHSHATAFAESGDAVLVITREADPTREEYAVRQEQRDGMTIAWINNTFSKTRSFAETYRNDRIAAAAARLIEVFRPDVAHVHHLTCLSTTIVHELARRGVPTFMTLHDYWLICHRGQLLDVDLKICAGPEPAGCGSCVGLAGGLGAGAYAARTVLSSVQRVLPDAVVDPMRSVATRLAGASASGDRGREESAARMTHMREVAGHVTRFFAPSAFMRNRFVAFGIRSECITVSEYGCSLPGITRAQREASASPPLRLGFLGSLMVSKAPHILLEAVAMAPPGSVTVDLFGEHVDYHGDASYRARLEPLLGQRGVRLRGKVTRDGVAAAFSEMDALVVPSIWQENSPLVIREAFLAGVPVVASRIGGIPETVAHDVNGLLFAPGDPADLARSISRLLREPKLLQRLRSGIPPVRTLADDVAATRAAYASAMVAPRVRRRLAAIVLNYRTPDDTFLAVRSLLLSSRPVDDILVVDNETSERCRAALAPFGDRVTYLAAGINQGFSGGMNLGIREALARGADRVLIVNSDVVVPVDSLQELEGALDGQAGAGIAGPAILARHAPDRVASLGIDYDKTTGRMRHRGVGDPFTNQSPAVQVIDAVTGCLMLVTRDVFNTIGLFDVDYFFGFEDVDFCLRARTAGFTTILAGRATALHEGGRSIGARSLRRLYFGARNQLLMARRTSRGSGRVASAARTGTIVALNVAHALRADGGTVASRLAAVSRGTRDYFRGRFGPDSRDRSIG